MADVAWFADNSGGTTHPVGGKLANGYGFHDVLGNVWDWTADCYGASRPSAVTDPKEAASCSDRVQRGCFWGFGADALRASHRGMSAPAGRCGKIGLRVARTP